jgi:hypothetical protein
MNLFWPLIMALLLLAACVFYDDNQLPSNAVEQLNQGWFAFGVLVRMAISVMLMTLTALLISAVLQTA